MTLGEKIKLARAKKKMSQQELGKLADTHQKNISKYEQDLVVPSALTLKSIADTLEVTTDYLLGNGQQEVIQDIALLRLFRTIDTMPDDNKTALVKVIEAYIRDFKTMTAYAS